MASTALETYAKRFDLYTSDGKPDVERALSLYGLLTMTDPLQDSDRTALHELLESRGWQLFCQSVLTEIADEFENDITKALSHEDGIIAVDRMRQVAAVRKAGLRWLELPKRKLGMLERQQEADAQMARPGRRPAGL